MRRKAEAVWTQPHNPTAHGGIRLGISPVVVDLGFDRIQGHSGFSLEISGLLPLFRIPHPKDQKKHYLRFFAGPGLGYRAGDGPFGGYGSARVMAMWLSDDRIYQGLVLPYVEYERRFPFVSALQGDNKLAFGLMFALCRHCGG